MNSSVSILIFNSDMSPHPFHQRCWTTPTVLEHAKQKISPLWMLTSFSTLSDKGRAISLSTHHPKKMGSSPDFHCWCLTMQSRNTLLVKIDDSQRWRFGSGRLSNHDRSVFANCLTKGASAWSAIVHSSPHRYVVCKRRLSYCSRNSTTWSLCASGESGFSYRLLYL